MNEDAVLSLGLCEASECSDLIEHFMTCMLRIVEAPL